MIMCVRGNFQGIAESPAGFGKTREEAEADLERQESKPQPEPIEITDAEYARYLELAGTDAEAADRYLEDIKRRR
jgi:hypothetical protein